MSGLLHRLASQAMGTGGATVHAAARSRYNEPLTGMAPDQASSVAPSGLRRAADRLRDRALHSDSGTAAVSSNAGAVGIVDDPDEERAFRSMEPAEASVSVMPAIAPLDGAPHGQITPAQTVTAPRREPPDRPVPARAVDVPANAAPRPRVPRQLVEHHGPDRTEPATAPRPVVDRPLTGARAAEPNEVHVHIGRIELTAVHTPASPKRVAPVPLRTSLSLTDYLAQRQRRAP